MFASKFINKTATKNVIKRPFFSELIVPEIVSCGINTNVIDVCIACSLPIIGLYNTFKIAKPDQYLVRTGGFIPEMSITKKGFVIPIIHTHQFISLQPNNYAFSLHAMSSEKIPFNLPGVFTIGPKDTIEDLTKYTKFLQNTDITPIILGILEGETRTLVSTMTMEDLFNDGERFRRSVVKSIQKELDQYGLIIQNSNIKELLDSDDSDFKYFRNMMLQKASSVENQAKISVAEANKLGNIGHKEREAITRRDLALLESTTIMNENNSFKDIQISNAELSVITANSRQVAHIADIESKYNSTMREFEMIETTEKKNMMLKSHE